MFYVQNEKNFFPCVETIMSKIMFLSETLDYIRNYRRFDRYDWLCYVSWIGLMMGLFVAVGGFLAVGYFNGVNFPSYLWNLPVGVFILLLFRSTQSDTGRSIKKLLKRARISFIT